MQYTASYFLKIEQILNFIKYYLLSITRDTAVNVAIKITPIDTIDTIICSL